MKTLQERKTATKMTIIMIVWVVGILLNQRWVDKDLPGSALWFYMAAGVALVAAAILWPSANFQVQKKHFQTLLWISFVLVGFGFFMPPIG